MSLADEKYLALTTFKRSGTPVTSPVWAAPIGDGKIGFWTSSTSGKVKRLTHTTKVTVQPCDARGRVKAGTTAADATAEVISSGPLMDEIRTQIKSKYGFMTHVTKLLAKIGALVKRKKQPYGDRGVVITVV
jgi:uncharacterized protein